MIMKKKFRNNGLTLYFDQCCQMATTKLSKRIYFLNFSLCHACFPYFLSVFNMIALKNYIEMVSMMLLCYTFFSVLDIIYVKS